VVGDTLYGAARVIQLVDRREADSSPFDKLRVWNDKQDGSIGLERNFLHAAHLEFAHPHTGKTVAVDAPLPRELEEFLALLRTERVLSWVESCKGIK